MNQFTLVIIGIMMALALIGVLLLSGVIPGFSLGGGGNPAALIIWGIVPYDQMRDLIDVVNGQNQKIFSITYVVKNPGTYQNELVDALASGKGPDLWFLSQDLILKNKDKVFLLPFASFSERAFKDAFVQEGELFLSKDGIVALPFIIDPMVLYWNRDLAGGAGISQAPKTWDEFVSFVGRLTVRDASGNITQSGAAFGEFQNVDHAKDIISLLILQTGNPIVDPVAFRSKLSVGPEEAAQSPDGAVRFFTEFSDPAKTTYSWNRSLPGSKNAFIGGILAYYFGYASEYNDIAAKNPHLNFDVAEVPQITGGHIRLTFAKMQGLVVSKSTSNITQAATAAAKLTGHDAIAGLVKKIFLPPVRRDLLAEAISNPVLTVFYKSAIESKAWLEPDPEATNDMFRVMTESVLSGKKKISEAMRDAHAKLNTMLEKFKPK